MYQREPSPEGVRNVARPRSIVRVRPPRSELERALGPLRDAVGADRVASGAERQDRQLGAGGAARGEAVDDLVDGAVAAERADQLAPVGGGRARELGGVPRRLGEHATRARGRARRRALGQARPALAGRAVLRGRVDDHVRASRQCFGSESAARMASSVMRATAAFSSSSADAHELALDDDVGDREEAGRLDAAQRRDREEDGRFHLDAQARPGRTSAAPGPCRGRRTCSRTRRARRAASCRRAWPGARRRARARSRRWARAARRRCR